MIYQRLHTATMHIFIILISCILLASGQLLNEVKLRRSNLYDEDVKMTVGNDIELSEHEIKANETVMSLKLEELDYAFINPTEFNLSKHFFEYKDLVKEKKLFKLIKKMPKGALLHVHDTAVLNPDYLLNITYWKNLYVCCHGNDEVNFYFAKSLPKIKTKCPCHSKWQLLHDVRYSSGNIHKFDDNLKQHFTMVVNNPDVVYNDITNAWVRFQKYFTTSDPLIAYKPAWERYFNDTLKELRNDGIMYLEIRSVLPKLYDLDGKTYDSVATAEVYKKIVDDFMVIYPDFFGAKLIYAPPRQVSNETFSEYLRIAKKLKEKMPDFFAGFDLVGQEDLGNTLHSFLPQLVEARKDFDLFLHAGETNWNGLSTDENLFDALALGSKRIGHAFSLIKHPSLMEYVKIKKVPIEVNVVTNSVLKLVDDIRNHPLATWLAQGLPVLLGNGSPGLWGADPLSHDFYVTFVGVANRHADLRLLKKLAMNSIIFSTYPDKEKMIYEFERRWTMFIYWIIKNKSWLNSSK